MDEINNILTPRQKHIISYGLETLQREAWLAIEGISGAGKTTIGLAMAKSFAGRALMLTPVNVSGYRQEWTVIYDSEADCNLIGRLLPVTAAWPSLLSELHTGSEGALLIVLDNCHCLTHFASTVQQVKAIFPGARFVTLGAFTPRQRRQAVCRQPVWLSIPQPTREESEHVIVCHAGIDSALPVSFINRIASVSRGNLRLLARAGWCLRQVIPPDAALPLEITQDAQRAVLRCLPARRNRLACFFTFVLLATAGMAAGWSSANTLSHWFPAFSSPFLVLPSHADASQVDLTDEIMSTQDAMGLLYHVWGYDAEKGEAWCDQAYRANLTCLSGTSTQEALEKLGVPWIAQLHVAEKIVPVVIIGVSDSELIALAGQKTWRLRKDWFNEVWRGHYTLMWKLSPDGKSMITRKSSVDDILWLDIMLSRVLNTEAENTGEWTGLLTEKVRQFQSQNHLVTDGMIGQGTLIRLWQALGESPELLREQETK